MENTPAQRRRIVVALGGNALGSNLAEQMQALKVAASAIVDLVEDGAQVAIVHGNGPQVGMIETAFETAARVDHKFPILPMSVCTALSQGYIGYDLQNVIRMELDSRGMKQPVSTVITQVEADPNDPAFREPTKPISGFLSEEEASRLREQGIPVAPDSGRGWRRVVASPKPVGIVEKETISALLDAGQIPIACGGGGIPVAMRGGQYRGMSAVIDKDRAAAKLAELIGADTLIILTAVERVALFFGRPEERHLDGLTVSEAAKYIEEGHFGKGSMLPKVEAAVSFAASGAGRTALITLLEKAKDGILGKTGTTIRAD
jgi:carbamate kinase